MNWSENFGDAHAQLKQSFINAWISIKTGNSNYFFMLYYLLYDI
jgi:hypothetical protein